MHTVMLMRGVESRDIYTVNEFMSIRSWVNIRIGAEFPTPVVCLYQGKPLLRTEWEITIITADVVFLNLPLGGGGGGGAKQIMAVIGMLIVTIVAIVAQQYWVPGALASAVASGALSAGAASAIGYGVAAAIMIGGSLLVNALFGQTGALPSQAFNSQSLESASPTYSLTGSQNQPRLYQMIPESFGTNMQTPDLAAQPWLEYAGQEQYLYQLMCVGIGEYHIHSINIEDTAIWQDGEYTGNFPEVTIQIVNPGEKVTLFPDNVETSPEVSGQSLNKGPLGPFMANSAGTVASMLAVDVAFPRGLGRMPITEIGMPSPPGGLYGHNVSILFECRRVDDFGNPASNWETLLAPTYSASTMTPQRFSGSASVPLGRYEVRAQCTAGWQEDQHILNEVAWVGLRAFLPSDAVYPDITLIAVRARASNSLSQQSSRQFKVLHTRKLPTWNRNTGWSAPTPTNSWAWAMASIAKAPWGGRRTDRQLDLEALSRLDAELAVRGDEFCQVLDTRQTVWSLFNEACRCARAVPRVLGSVVSWVRDSPNLPVRGVFTPYNIMRDTFSIEYAFFSDDSPDDVIIEYRDRDNWQERDVRAVLPDSMSLEPARKRLMGITSRAQAYREACFETACNAYRRIFPKWTTELEGRLIFRGDRVLITHPIGGESNYANVTGWSEHDRALVLNRVMPWEGDGHYLVLRRPNGASWGPVKVASVEEKIVTLNAESLQEVERNEFLTSNSFRPVWEWLSDGSAKEPTAVIYGKETPGVKAIILSVKPRQNGQCEIEAMLEDDRVHVADLGTVPPWTPSGALPSMRPYIEGLYVSLELSDDRKMAHISVSWLPTTGARAYLVRYRAWREWRSWEVVGTSVGDGHYAEDGAWIPGNETDIYDWVWHEGWSEWNLVTETLDTNADFYVPAALLEVQVCALVDAFNGPWETFRADCSKPMPGTPELAISAPYVGGNLSVEWPAITAESIMFTLSAGGREVTSTTVAGTSTALAVTASELATYNGPWRRLTISAIAKNSTWFSPKSTLDVSDPAPESPQGLEAVVNGDTIHVSWLPSSGEVTGYIIRFGRHGQSMQEEETDDEKFDLPTGEPGTYTFTVAARDDLYDIIHDRSVLNFSTMAEVIV